MRWLLLYAVAGILMALWSCIVRAPEHLTEERIEKTIEGHVHSWARVIAVVGGYLAMATMSFTLWPAMLFLELWSLASGLTAKLPAPHSPVSADARGNLDPDPETDAAVRAMIHGFFRVGALDSLSSLAIHCETVARNHPADCTCGGERLLRALAAELHEVRAKYDPRSERFQVPPERQV